jgi:hypothetical protein
MSVVVGHFPLSERAPRVAVSALSPAPSSRIHTLFGVEDAPVSLILHRWQNPTLRDSMGRVLLAQSGPPVDGLAYLPGRNPMYLRGFVRDCQRILGDKVHVDFIVTCVGNDLVARVYAVPASRSLVCQARRLMKWLLQK